MSSKRIWKILAVVTVVLIAGFFVFANKLQAPLQVQNEEVPQASTIVLVIEGLYDGKPVSISSGETVLGVLKALNVEDSRLELATKEYSGLGVLVQSLAGKTNGEGEEYWQYKVNGVMPQVGADKLTLKDGDSVEWFFAKSEF